MVNAVGLKYYGGALVTVLSSKSSQRYRLQSDNLCALWLHAKQLEDRLHRLHQADLQCSYSSSLPMHEYFIEVDNHFNQRLKMRELLVSSAAPELFSSSRKVAGRTPPLFFRIGWRSAAISSGRSSGACWPASRTRRPRPWTTWTRCWRRRIAS